MILALALAVVQVAVAASASQHHYLQNNLYQRSLFGPCVYLGAPCAAKNTVCTIYPSLESDQVHAAFLHAEMPSMRVKRNAQAFGAIGRQGWGGSGGGGGGYNGGGSSGGYGGQPPAPSSGYGSAPAPAPTYNAPAPEPAPASYGAPPPPPPTYNAPAPPPEPAPASYAPAPAPAPAPTYGSNPAPPTEIAQVVGGYGETTDRPVVINEETVQLPVTEEEQSPEYKYFDTRSDTQQNRQLENQKEVHTYSVQKHRVNKKIYNVHRTHQHEHINTNHVLNIYRHNHPHTETEYVTYVYNKYVPKKYVHYSRSDQVQEKGVEEHPTQDVVQKTIQKPPEFAPVEVVQSGYDGTPLNKPVDTTIAIQPPAPQPAYAGRRKREAVFGNSRLQAICMCAETFVPTQGIDGGCDCPEGLNVKADGRCA